MLRANSSCGGNRDRCLFLSTRYIFPSKNTFASSTSSPLCVETPFHTCSLKEFLGRVEASNVIGSPSKAGSKSDSRMVKSSTVSLWPLPMMDVERQTMSFEVDSNDWTARREAGSPSRILPDVKRSFSDLRDIYPCCCLARPTGSNRIYRISLENAKVSSLSG
jgi:hypothetical protein